MSTNTRESDRSLNVAKQIAALRQIGVGGLRERYEEVFGEPTRAGNKDFLFKRIAWRIQSLAEGDLAERARWGPPAGNPVRRAGGRHHAQLLDWIRMRRDLLLGNDVCGPLVPARAIPHRLALALHGLLTVPIDLRFARVGHLLGCRIGVGEGDALNYFQRSARGFAALGAPRDQVGIL